MVVATNGKPSRAGEEIFAYSELGGRTDLTDIERARDTIEKRWEVRIFTGSCWKLGYSFPPIQYLNYQLAGPPKSQ